MICMIDHGACAREIQGNFKEPTMPRTDNDSDLLTNQNSLVPEEICFRRKQWRWELMNWGVKRLDRKPDITSRERSFGERRGTMQTDQQRLTIRL